MLAFSLSSLEEKDYKTACCAEAMKHKSHGDTVP